MAYDATTAPMLIGKTNSLERLDQWKRIVCLQSKITDVSRSRTAERKASNKKEQDEAYFKCVKYDIQFDGVLSAYGVIYLACISERDEN
jgi:hypothetical protein